MSGKAGEFAEVNEAYQVLREPKRRLQHLLALEDAEPPRAAAVPREIADLFPRVATLMHAAAAALEQRARAGNALNISLAKTAALQTGGEIAAQLEQLRAQQAAALEELRQRSHGWEAQLPALQQLYLALSYLTRWIAELEEKALQLAN